MPKVRRAWLQSGKRRFPKRRFPIPRIRPRGTSILAISALVTVLVIAITGSAGGSYALWNASVTVDAGTIQAGTISADIEIAPSLDVTYSPGDLTKTGAFTITNNGTAASPYTT